MSSAAVDTCLIRCKHCHDTIKSIVITSEQGDKFCCNGCKTVYSIINSNGLSNFYKIRDEEEFNPTPVGKEKANFDYMDDINFKNEFIISNKSNDEHIIKFYLEGIHCMACIWLIEKTPEVIEGLLNARLNITDSTAEFTFKSQLPAKQLAKTLLSLGYYPHPIAIGDNANKYRSAQERSEVLKIGIAAAAMGNVMVYAVSNYAGADGHYKDIFNWLCFVLSIPVVFYSALPFYKTSLQAIKLKSISIDIPISIAIIAGFTFSFIGLFTGSDHNYFDSISALVFLILISRYFVKKATQQGLNNKGLATIFSNTQVTRIENAQEISVHSNYVYPGDTIKIHNEEKIVFDGVLLSKNAQVDNSVLSGESKPCRISEGELVWAGSINLADDFLMTVKEIGNKTKLGKVIESISKTDFAKNKIVSSADKISKYFVWVVTILTTVQFFYMLGANGINEAIERALAIIIISCPCALALATPLAYVKSLDVLKSFGIFIKEENVLEEINKSNDIFLDKTGTLTKGKFEVLNFENFSSITDTEIHGIVNALERESIHPIATSLKKYFKTIQIQNLDLEFKESIIQTIPGNGVSLELNGDLYFFGKVKPNHIEENIYTQVALYKNDQLLAKYTIGDEIKESSLEFIKKLVRLGKRIHILSGDNFGAVSNVASSLGISNFHSNLSPEDKAHIISKYDHAIMVGDGINDVLAFNKASVSIAVSGSADLSLRACDVFMTSQSLNNLLQLIIISKQTRHILIRNFVFSIVYNVFGVGLALLGMITPLWAAVFMPASSLSVVFSSVFSKHGQDMGVSK